MPARVTFKALDSRVHDHYIAFMSFQSFALVSSCSQFKTCMMRNVGISFLFCTLCIAGLDFKYSWVFLFFVSYLVCFFFYVWMLGELVRRGWLNNSR